MAKSKLAEATTSVYEILEPFSEEERSKIVRAAMMLLGQTPPGPAAPASRSVEANGALAANEATDAVVGPKARRWLNQNSITSSMLEECFHLEADPPEVVAEVPGNSAREKTANCYLLTGIAAFLKTEEPTFSDTTARALCEHVGCYDATNHTKYVKLGNQATGDKKRGWKLLAPGLKNGAALLKQIVGDAGE